VLAKAQELRVADDADYAKDKHLAAALEALDLDAHAYDLPEATSGVGSIN
jgi:lactoylglutathione lyase